MGNKPFVWLVLFPLLASCAQIEQDVRVPHYAAEPVELVAGEPDNLVVGRLKYRGGIQFTSSNKDFGGLSGLHVVPDGRSMVAVSDRGYWFSSQLVYDKKGDLAGAEQRYLMPLLGPDARPLEKVLMRDAEALRLWPGRGWLVAFERNHRIWLYPLGSPNGAGTPLPLPPPDDLARAPLNGGIEAMAVLADGRIVAITESFGDERDSIGWIGDGADWLPVLYRRVGDFRPTDAVLLPDGDLLVLERSHSVTGDWAARLVKVPGAQVAPGGTLIGQELAVLQVPHTVDNFEAVAARKGAQGETLIYILSDDNYSSFQASYLMMFELIN